MAHGRFSGRVAWKEIHGSRLFSATSHGTGTLSYLEPVVQQKKWGPIDRMLKIWILHQFQLGLSKGLRL